VAHVDVRAPELLAEDFELTVGPEFARELVDGQVEAHAPAHAVHGRNAKAGRLDAARSAAEDQLLHPDLLFGVQRNRAELYILGDRHRRIGHAAIVGAGGGEHEPLNARLTRVGDETSCGLHVDLVGELGIAPARRVADDRGKVDDAVDARERAFARLCIADVRADHLNACTFLLGRDVLLAVQKRVEHPNLVLRLAQLLNEECPDVAAAARD
jgi:hypothetical protein